jgi:hypothetical protein
VRRILEAMAGLEWTDDRNEATPRFAQAALEGAKDIGLPFI